MKVVINRCFGGFGLSDQAFELLLQRKGIEYERVPAEFQFNGCGWDYYRKGHVKEEDHFLWHMPFTSDRSDKDLIDVVEQLGDQANSFASELKIIEVPDDVEWHIAEYDGWEHVAENHRTWP